MEPQTQGAQGSGFEPIQPEAAPKKTSVDTGSGNDWPRAFIQGLPQVMTSLEDKFIFFGALLSIIGYIIIATFGGITSVGQYFGYILFLFIVFAAYKVINEKKILFGILVVALLCLLAIVSYQNMQLINGVGKNLFSANDSLVTGTSTTKMTATSTSLRKSELRTGPTKVK